MVAEVTRKGAVTRRSVKTVGKPKTQANLKHLPKPPMRRILTSGQGTSLGDLFTHLIPHIRYMPPHQLRREFLIITTELLRASEEHFTVSPQLQHSIAYKAHEVACMVPSRLAETIVGFVLWLDGFQGGGGESSSSSSSQSFSPQRTSDAVILDGAYTHTGIVFRAECLEDFPGTYTDKDQPRILDVLFHCYGVKRFGFEVLDINDDHFYDPKYPNLKIIIGDADVYKRVSFKTTRRVLGECYNVKRDGLMNNFRTEIILHTNVTSFVGTHALRRLRIKQIRPMRDEMTVIDFHGDHTARFERSLTGIKIHNVFAEVPLFRDIRKTSRQYTT